MKITFVSNYINHHQIPLSNVLYKILGEEYHFIQTEPMEEERVRMGWSAKCEEIPYLKILYEEREQCLALINESDVVIFGWAPEELIQSRLLQGRLVIRYSERIYKEGQWRAISPRGLLEKYHAHVKYRKKSVYLLCAGAYVASDFHLIGAYPKKMYRWGYFPEYREYNVDNLLEQKMDASNGVNLLWAGRLIDWKHAEMLIPLATYLKEKKYKFHLSIIGDGEKKEEIQSLIHKEGLEKFITLEGMKAPDMVREYMEKAEIYLTTSDYREGWGAVINEAMNSGCAVVASHAMGATPYLIKHRENGLIFQSGNPKDLIRNVELLIKDCELRQKLGRAAYHTIAKQWNAEIAGKRLVEMCDGILKKEKVMFKDGPCSKAPIVAPFRMYREVTK